VGEALGLFLDGPDDDRGVCPVDWRARRMVGDMATFMDFVMSGWAWNHVDRTFLRFQKIVPQRP
jgi:hypothetical protein